MRIGFVTVAACALVGVCVDGAAQDRAQDRAMTLAEVLARAREQAPQIVSARLALEETRARQVGASVRLQKNPEIEGWVGNRSGPDRRFTDFEIGVAQGFEPGSRRTARVAGADAALAQGAAHVDDVTRDVLRIAAAAYYRVVYANDRIKLLEAAYDLAAAVHSSADRRFKAGDIAILDVNIARATLGRVRAEREAAEASKALALGELRQILRMDTDVSIAGNLTRPSDADLNAALQAAADRPEIRALEAGIREAEAESQLGQSFGKPDYGLGVRYSREEGDQIVLGGVTLALPMFSKGQELRAAGSARAARLRAELEAARTRLQIEVRTAFAAFGRRLAAVRALEADAIPGLDENDQLTTRSFDVGQIGLPNLLLIRREILDTRFQYLDALLEAALARVDLDASAGVLR
jgi:cobalt-zinc-cadmium efflux system outer membrane protein